MPTIEIYRDDSEKKEGRWRVTAANGQIVHVSSEGYNTKAGAQANLEKLVSAVENGEGLK